MLFLLTSVFNHANYPDSKALLKTDFIYLGFSCFWQISLTYFYFTETQSKFIISYLNIRLWHRFIVHVFFFSFSAHFCFSEALFLLWHWVFCVKIHYSDLCLLWASHSIQQNHSYPFSCIFSLWTIIQFLFNQKHSSLQTRGFCQYLVSFKKSPQKNWL